ncbi:MAG: hypothetical protein FJ276_22915 [Planctomycetes bacterium]|nr:hypothetical protein [Planctomycetota bacterium]
MITRICLLRGTGLRLVRGASAAHPAWRKPSTVLAAIVVCAVAFVPNGARAQAPAEKIPTVLISLYPTAEPVPALKYQLLPAMIERRPGNAAVIYGKVTAEQSAFFGNEKLQENIAQWLEMPFDEFPKEQVRKEFRPPLHFLRMAARCESCDWDLPIREEMFYAILLPDVQQTRQFGRVLALQARVHIAHHEYDQALETLQMGYALGRHVAEQPTLVSNLVAIAIHGQMLGRMMEWIQQPDSPNLYWALSALPRPMVDLRRAMEVEMYSIYFSFPELRDLDTKDYPPAYWQYLLDKYVREFAKLMGAPPAPEVQRVMTAALVLQGYPKAKQWLIEQGRKAEDVEKMPVAQVVLLYTVHTYDELRDDMFKFLFVPFVEAKKGLQQAEEKLQDAIHARGREIIPLASVVLPAVGAVKNAEVRGQREIALLRVLEALRLYASKHGRLPDSLNDITEVPIPKDPVRDEPFTYQAHDRRSAVLEVLGPPGTWGGYPSGARYEIELKK